MENNMINDDVIDEEYNEILHSLKMGCYMDYENDLIIFKDFKYNNVLKFDSDFTSPIKKWRFLNEIVNRINTINTTFSKIAFTIKQYIDFSGPEKSLAEKYYNIYENFNIFPCSAQNLDDYMRFKEWLKWRFRQIQTGE